MISRVFLHGIFKIFQEDVGKLKETLSELGDTEEKRLSGLRVEREELSKELHSTRRSVSIDFRNREQKKMQKLAVHTDLLQKKVDEILFHQDQMIKVIIIYLLF